jgi:hypothetical protein
MGLRGADGERGAHQVVLTVRAPVRPDRIGALRSALASMNDGAPPALPFGELSGLHFARFVLLEESTDLDGRAIPATLLYMAELDAPAARHVDELADRGAASLDLLLDHCADYPASPTPAERAAYLRAHAIPSQANYVNAVGRTVDQVRREDELRRAIEAFLDASAGSLPDTPEGVREAIQRFVRGEPSLGWATRRAQRPSLRWRAREALHLARLALGLTLAAPFALLALPFYAIALRRQEIRDPAPHVLPDPEHVRELAALEDRVAHNQFAAVGYVKPGALRRVTVAVVLWLIDAGARHVFTRADLAGVKTIHFAHWTMLDEGRRVIFTSYYDGSLEAYMDDFIDKVAFGLNASFSNGVGFPRTRFLLFEGAHREQEFKDHLRRRQIPSQVWYSAQPQLSALNIENNALIRSGLFGPLTRPDTETWLRRL